MDEKLVKIEIKNMNDEVVAEFGVRKGPVYVNYNPDDKGELCCRAGVVTDCIQQMFSAYFNEGNDEALAKAAGDFLLSILKNGDEVDDEIEIKCSSYENCHKENNCYKA